MHPRVGIGGISHETNTYLTVPTVLDRFLVHSGDEVVAAEGTRTYIGGMVAGARAAGLEPVGLFHAMAWPSGPIEHRTYERLLGQLLLSLEQALPLDAVALDLHGAGAAEGVADLEGEVCAAVRAVVGPDVPIVATHDLHGNVSQRFAADVDLLLPVHHYPHDDMYERGEELLLALPRLLSGQWRPTAHLQRLPMLIPPTTTYCGVAAEVLALCQEAEAEPGVIDCSFLHGFPYTDSAEAGCTVIVTTDADPALAERLARRVAQQVWLRRDRFLVDHPMPADAVRRALDLADAPVVMNETSDNPGGGTMSDGTHLLRALLEAGAQDAALSAICDPEVVATAHAAGVGARISVELGGKTDDLHGEPVAVEAYVKVLTDGGATIEAQMGAGYTYSMGRTARLVVDGVDVIVSSLPLQTIDRTPFVLHGIDPRTRKIVAVKSSQHFRSGFQGIAAAVVTTDPPGLTTMRLDQLPREVTSGLWPVDRAVEYAG